MVASYKGNFQEPSREAQPKVEDFMSRSHQTLKADDDIYKAVELLLKHKISGALVVDDEHYLIGFVSEKDCLKMAASDAYEASQHGGPVKNYMTAKVRCVTPETSLSECADLFMHTPYRKLPVVNADNKVLGVVRRRDVLSAMLDFYNKSLVFAQTQD